MAVRPLICKMMDANPSRWNLTDVNRLNWKLIRTPGESLSPDPPCGGVSRGGPGKLVNRLTLVNRFEDSKNACTSSTWT